MHEKIDMERINRFIKDFGHYNSLPKPFIILTPKRYYYETNSFSVYETEHRQVIDKEFGKYARSLTIQWGFDRGFGILMPAEWHIVGEHCEFKEFPTFFRFGCDHDYKRVENLGNCLNKYTCTKCGCTEVVDSSD